MPSDRFTLRIKLTAAASTILAFLAVGTLAYHFLEGWDWIASFYFSVTTLTTVGYGDLYPTTPASQLFTAFFILTGVALVVAALSIVGSEMLTRREENLAAKRPVRGG